MVVISLNSKYKTLLAITILLVVLSLSISTINYIISLNNAEKYLKTQSLPLTLDNIYTDIQKQIIEPYLVSSMMANDTFVQDWILHDEENSHKIAKYLETIKNKYNMFNAFLVSDITKNYYTQNGFIEKVTETAPDNKWYFDFKDIQNKHEINLDFNQHLSNSLIMFINYKIFDSNYQFIGATGVALKIAYINDMLKKFRINYNFKVTFFNEAGDIVLAEKGIEQYENINQIEGLKRYKDQILSKESKIFEYKSDATYIINTKYIPELDLYLSVEANVDQLTKDVKNVFYLNMFLSFFITFAVAFMVYLVIKRYSTELEHLSKNDALTEISNRRDFEIKFHHQFLLHKRNKQDIAIIFADVDNFKLINDTFGHAKGDIVLKTIAKVLKESLRGTDLIARWGGEEFVIALIDSSLENSQMVAEKLRGILAENIELKNLIGNNITASFGLSMMKESDTQDNLIARADDAMYMAKKEGKNKVCIKL